MLVLTAGFYAFVAIEHQETSGATALAGTSIALTCLLSTAGLFSLMGTRSRNLLQRAAYLQKRRIDKLVASQTHHMKKQTSKIGEQSEELKQKSIEILKTKAELAAAQKIVSKVMAEGGTALEQFHLKHSELTLNQPIGEGSFGTVYAAELRGEKVAVKTVRSTAVSETTLQKFREEIIISKCYSLSGPPAAVSDACAHAARADACPLLHCFCPLRSGATLPRQHRADARRMLDRRSGQAVPRARVPSSRIIRVSLAGHRDRRNVGESSFRHHAGRCGSHGVPSRPAKAGAPP